MYSMKTTLRENSCEGKQFQWWHTSLFSLVDQIWLLCGSTIKSELESVPQKTLNRIRIKIEENAKARHMCILKCSFSLWTIQQSIWSGS